MKKSCAAVVVAAGTARRMGGVEKIMTSLNGVPILLRTVRALAASGKIDEIVIVTRKDLLAAAGELCGAETKLKAVVAGGKTRTESVLCGLRAVGDAELIAIHDGARPLVTPAVIDAAIDAAAECGAAAPAVAVHDTVKIASAGFVERTPDRNTLFAVQTPQVFSAKAIRYALQHALDQGILLTDDCSAAEALGLPVRLTEGSEENVKITVPLDLTVAEAILKRRGTA